MAEAYIVEALRTAGGRRGGALRDWHPVDLGAAVLDALVARSGIDPAAIDDVIVGCVGQIGEQSFHVGRNMVLASSLPQSVPAVTIDRQCGSSQQSVHFAAQAVMSGVQDVVIAAGVESMTRVPMGLPVILPMQAGIGTGPWPQSIKDRFGVSEFSQFTGAEMIARDYGLNRDDLDAFAAEDILANVRDKSAKLVGRLEQVRATVKNPCWKRTCPCPWHCGQLVGVVRTADVEERAAADALP